MEERQENPEQTDEPQLAKMETSDESETPGAALNRAVRATEYLAVRHAMPKTNISNVILYENTSQERHLVRQLSSLTLRRERQKNILDLQRRAFVQKQTRKQKKWKREDEFSLNNMNLPSLDKKGENRPDSIAIMYRNPDYQMKPRTPKESDDKPSLPPLVEIKREKTEIVFHGDKTFITKVPMSVSLNQTTLKHHLRYCGKNYLTKGKAAQDKRFQKLDYSLAPTISRSEDFTASSQRRRGSTSSSKSGRSARRAGVRRSSAQVVMPVQRRSTPNRKSLASFDTKSAQKYERAKSDLVYTAGRNAMDRKEILNEFKTGDIKRLSRNLSMAD